MTQADMPNLSALFSGLKEAKPSMDVNYMKPGEYAVRIDNCKAGRTRKMVPYVAVEATVVRVFDDANGRGHRVGEQITHFMGKDNDYFLGDVKSFVAAMLGMNPDDVGEEEAISIFGGDNPLGQFGARVSARQITTKSGGDFTKINWQGEIPAGALLEMLEPAVIERFWPNNLLQQLAAAETNQGPA